MKRLFLQIICIFISVTLFLCGCSQNKVDFGSTLISHDTEITSQDPLITLKQWLKTDFSFALSYQYMNLAVSGMSQETTQTFATDGSWLFNNRRKIWDHTTNYESEENAEYYYRYENSQLVCYSSIDGNTPQRIVLTEREKTDMDESKSYLVGVYGLLPNYMHNFAVNQSDGVTILNFQLPVEKVLADNTLLSVFVENVFSLSGVEYKSEYNVMIPCSFTVDSQTFQPKSLSYDFAQLKPYVLSNGAQSGEYVFDTDFLTMVYTFDYNLPDTIEIPTHLIP